jgi:hypothetical protein
MVRNSVTYDIWVKLGLLSETIHKNPSRSHNIQFRDITNFPLSENYSLCHQLTEHISKKSQIPSRISKKKKKISANLKEIWSKLEI